MSLLRNALPPGKLGKINIKTNQLLLDKYSGATLALGLRKLKSDYSGACIRVRNETTNIETDIGFSSNNSIDSTSLANTAILANSFVTTTYDLSKNSNHNIQTTTTAQPRIINGGTIDSWNGKPTITFDGINDCFSHPNLSINGFSIFAVLKIIGSMSGYRSLFSSNNFNSASGMMLLINTNANKWGTYGASAERNANSGLSLNSIYLLEMHRSSSGDGVFYKNNTYDGLFSVTNSQTVAHIGGTNSFQNAPVQLSELIFYPFNNEANRAAIAANINAYYSIY
ncbi:hypothetical protein [Scytonema sp. NUACC26]|uniref:hypothetical protein n=1 Tax=Scytonema sp. NUACC26 TaxID=3140176 RepID=UPI0034DC80E6